jgi:hypothetical protein
MKSKNFSQSTNRYSSFILFRNLSYVLSISKLGTTRRASDLIYIMPFNMYYSPNNNKSLTFTLNLTMIKTFGNTYDPLSEYFIQHSSLLCCLYAVHFK